jgi:hypothetical protein
MMGTGGCTMGLMPSLEKANLFFQLSFLGVLVCAPARAEWRDSPFCTALISEVGELAGVDQCRNSAECATVDLPFPTECQVPVSKREAHEIDRLLDLFRRSCAPLLFNCFEPVRSTWCERGRCVLKLKKGGVRYPSSAGRNQYGRPLR